MRAGRLGRLLVVAGLSLSAASRAELVVLDDGRILRAAGFRLDGERVSVELREGGILVLDLDRVERIVDDEVDRSEPPQAPPETPGKSVRGSPDGPLKAPPAYAGLIREAASEFRLDPGLVAAVIRAESGFSPKAVSRKGARGLMQLMPATARRLGVRHPFDPAENVRGGAAYLSELAERYGEGAHELILAAYNAGEGAVAAWGGVPPFRETRDYVRRVSFLWSGD